MPRPILNSGDTAVNKTGKITVLRELLPSAEGQKNKTESTAAGGKA